MRRKYVFFDIDHTLLSHVGTSHIPPETREALRLLKANGHVPALATGRGAFLTGTRNVGGVNLKTIETDFGTLNIMLDRYVPADKLIVASLEQLSPVFMEIPNKGHFFAEPLAKTGASDDVQIYGEIGLEYGNEKAHGCLTVAAG